MRGCKRLSIVLLPIFLICAIFVVCRAPVTANAESHAYATVRLGENTVRVYDTPLVAPNHIIEEEITARRLNAPLISRVAALDEALEAGASYAYAVERYFPRLYSGITELKSKCDRPAEDSKITFYPDRKPMFSITREKAGISLDVEKTCRLTYVALKRCAVKSETKCVVDAATSEVLPTVAVKDNARLTTLISRFTTTLGGSTAARKHNVALALNKVNGTTLAPLETFSFNATVGARSAANGFQEAKIIVGGEYVTGYGGGVCQASTTLYNAALTAGLKVTAVRNHTLEPSYVPPSFDAMVNSGSSDLTLVNGATTPVFIRAYVAADRAVVEIYGAALEYKIVPESVIVERGETPADQEVVDTEHKYLPLTAAQGERMRIANGKGKVKSEGYLKYYSGDGRLVKREKIRSDVYAAHGGIVMIAP